MNPFQAEIWDPGLLSNSQSSLSRSSARRPSSKPSEYNSSDAESEEDKLKPPPSRKLSFTRDSFGFGSANRKRCIAQAHPFRNPSPSSADLVKKQSSTIWYRIFHPGEESDLSDHSSPPSPSVKPSKGLWARSRQTYDSDDEYHSDDSNASTGSSFMSLPPPAIKDDHKPSSRKGKTLNARPDSKKRSSPSLFHPKGGDESSDNEAQEAPTRRSGTNIFKDLFWRSSHPAALDAAPDLLKSTSSPQSPNASPRLSPARTASGTPCEDGLQVPTLTRNMSETSLSDKYGRPDSVLGKGATAVVRLCAPANSKEKRFAIKEFRKRRKDERQVSFSTFFLTQTEGIRQEIGG